MMAAPSNYDIYFRRLEKKLGREPTTMDIANYLERKNREQQEKLDDVHRQIASQKTMEQHPEIHQNLHNQPVHTPQKQAQQKQEQQEQEQQKQEPQYEAQKHKQMAQKPSTSTMHKPIDTTEEERNAEQSNTTTRYSERSNMSIAPTYSERHSVQSPTSQQAPLRHKFARDPVPPTLHASSYAPEKSSASATEPGAHQQHHLRTHEENDHELEHRKHRRHSPRPLERCTTRHTHNGPITYGVKWLSVLVAGYLVLIMCLIYGPVFGFSWDSMPPEMPPSLSVRLQVGLPDRVQHFGKALYPLHRAQYDLTYAHGAYCTLLEAVCQLLPDPQSHPFYKPAVALWESSDVRSCPRPQACTPDRRRQAYKPASAHPMAVDWEKAMAQYALALGDLVHEGVGAGDALLSHVLNGTEQLEAHLQHLSSVASGPDRSRWLSSYSRNTNVAWLCRLHTTQPSDGLVGTFVMPFCTTALWAIEWWTIGSHHHHQLHTNPLPTTKWVTEMNLAFHALSAALQSTSRQASSHIATMMSLAPQCMDALQSLRAKGGPESEPAKQMHLALNRACDVFAGQELIDSMATFNALISEMHIFHDTTLPLIVSHPALPLLTPKGASANDNYSHNRNKNRNKNVLIFDPANDALELNAALSLWREWTLVKERTRINKALEAATQAMRFRQVERT